MKLMQGDIGLSR